MAGRAPRALLPALFFLAWAILFSFPLVLHLGEAVVLARGGDVWLHLWDLWWVDKALVDLHANPYHTNYILYPTGLNLYYHSLDLLNALVGVPLQHLAGLTSTFNLLVLANLTLDGLAAYWLCLDRTGSRGAALVGGALFASAPLLGTSLDSGQLDEMTVWWVPLYMLALFGALESPGPFWKPGGGRRAVLAAALCLVGASLATWYFTAGLVIFTVVYVPCYLLSRREGARLPAWVAAVLKTGAAVVLFALLLSPLLVGMVRERLSGATYMLPSLTTTEFNSADLVALFLPARLDSDLNRHGSTVALGYIAIVLTVVGLAWRWRKLWPLGLALVVLIVMAMGPQLQVNGEVTGIPLPYALLNNVPFVGASRQPLRFLATAAACLSILGSFGILALLERLRGNGARAALTVLGLALVGLELVTVPRLLTNTAVGPGFSFIRDSPEQRAVLEVPYDAWSAPALWHQTTHDRPIVGGYTSRHFPYPFSEAAPGVSQLFKSDPDTLVGQDILSPSPSGTALTSLDYYGVRFIVVHKADMATGRYNRLQQVIDTLFSEQDRAYEDSDVIVYRTPTLSKPGDKVSPVPLVGLGNGWHKIEQNPLHRWLGANVTDGNGYIWMGVPPGAEGHYTLKATVYAYRIPRHLSVVLDGRTLFTKEIGTGFEEINVDLGNVPVGDHSVLLKVDEPPESPPGDTRKLSIGVTSIVFEKTAP